MVNPRHSHWSAGPAQLRSRLCLEERPVRIYPREEREGHQPTARGSAASTDDELGARPLAGFSRDQQLERK